MIFFCENCQLYHNLMIIVRLNDLASVYKVTHFIMYHVKFHIQHFEFYIVLHILLFICIFLWVYFIILNEIIF